MRESVESLPESEREVVELHYIEGLSSKEVGAAVGVSAGAVRVRLHRARARLRDELAPFASKEKPREREERLMVEMKVDDVGFAFHVLDVARAGVKVTSGSA